MLVVSLYLLAANCCCTRLPPLRLRTTFTAQSSDIVFLPLSLRFSLNYFLGLYGGISLVNLVKPGVPPLGGHLGGVPTGSPNKHIYLYIYIV